MIKPVEFRRLIILLTLAMSLCSCGGGGSDSKDDTVEELQSIQEILDDAVQKGLDGIILSVEQSNGITQTYSAGGLDRSSKGPLNSQSLFKIASISKLFIAVSAAKMAHQDLISIDDSLAYWLPDIASHIENSDTITIKNMLQHRSGIPDFDSQQGFSWHDSHTDIDKTLALVLNKSADFFPDAKYEYSNTNYLLIAKILDKALGYSHHTFIQENILTPLAMHNTFSELSHVDVSLMVKGYWDNVDTTLLEYVIPGGSMISTAQDIALFIRALNTGNLLINEEREIYKLIYGFSHSGWVPGYQSIANYNAGLNAVIVQFVNTTGGNSENISSETYKKVINRL